MPGPNSSNQYTPQAVGLDGGLDFITPKVSVNGGTLSAGLNAERTDRVGYSKIKGYEPFDGNFAPSLAYTNLVYILHSNYAIATTTRTALRVQNQGANVLGEMVDVGVLKSLIAITNFDQWRLVLSAVNAGGSIVVQTPVGDSITVTGYQSYEEGYADSANSTAKKDVLARNELFKATSVLVEHPGPAANPVIGLHGYKDQLYAVKDLQTVYFTGGNKEIFGNDILRPHGLAFDTFDLRVLNVRLISGTYVGGDAVGVIEVFPTSSAVFTIYDLIRPQSITNNVLTIGAPPSPSVLEATHAGMWRSNSFAQADLAGINPGWEFVDLGYYFDFDQGTQYGPPRIFRRGKFSVYTTDVLNTPDVCTAAVTVASTHVTGGAPIAGDSWTFTGTNLVDSVTHDGQTSKYVRRTINNTTSAADTNLGQLNLTNFTKLAALGATAGVNVEGLEVVVRTRGQPITGIRSELSMFVQPLFNGGLAPNTTSEQLALQTGGNPDYPVSPLQYLTFGGPTDLWGLDSAGMKAIMDSTFGVSIQPWASQVSTGQRQATIDTMFVQATIYFTQDITNYYFWNGSDDVTADITNVFADPGSDPTASVWDGTATGTIQVTNIQPVGSADRQYVENGDQIRTAPGGAGLLVATVNSNSDYNGLDTLAEIEGAKSRYEFITSNFYAEDDFEAMYGVSGAGRAFSYDGFYFDRIYTQADASKDKPRHIENHQFHLALGYSAGAVLLSVTGNPQDFSGVNGATEIDTGDPVQGLAKMPGTMLGVLCKNTIQAIVGTSADNFALNILNPYEGAIEYTVRDIGKLVYCSYRGLSFLDATSAYGSFANQRLSYLVSPWLLPRLQGTVTPVGVTAASSGPVCAVACRTTNQYRLYFGDGYRLTMTLSGPDLQPIFTIQAEGLYDDDGVFLGYVVPRADSSFVDSLGAERIHLSHYSESVPLDVYHAYEYEKSWTFNGNGIPFYVVSNANFFNSPFNYDNVRKLRLHGLSFGYAPITVHIDKNYEKNQDINTPARTNVDASLPRDTASILSNDYDPTTSMSDVATRGRSFSMRFNSYNTTNQPTYVLDPVYAEVCPPFVLQAMLPQHTENKGDV